MKKSKARFQVNSRLARILSQEYASSEKALKELIDNAWDADADKISISLPVPMSDSPIVISDDGTGMTSDELRNHYLSIASDRRERSGERTAGKQRLVKGRKGIGKFAGLMAASVMTLETYARGIRTSFTLRLHDLLKADDIERLPIDLAVDPCDTSAHGTRITLTELDQQLAFPDPQKLRQILLQEYGRETGLAIIVDGKPLGVDDVVGTLKDSTLTVPGVGDVRLRFAIAENTSVSRQPGIVIRVDGKVVGKPSFFGLDGRDDFPPKLLKRLYGEIDADGLRDHVTAGWDSLVENSELLARVTELVAPLVFNAFKETHGREIQLAHARLRRDIKERLAALPEHRREYAENAIKKILERFYREPAEKVEPFVSCSSKRLNGQITGQLFGTSRKRARRISPRSLTRWTNLVWQIWLIWSNRRRRGKSISIISKRCRGIVRRSKRRCTGQSSGISGFLVLSSQSSVRTRRFNGRSRIFSVRSSAVQGRTSVPTSCSMRT